MSDLMCHDIPQSFRPRIAEVVGESPNPVIEHAGEETAPGFGQNYREAEHVIAQRQMFCH